MDTPFFTMKPRKTVYFKYILMAAFPTVSAGILLTWHAGAWVFLLMATVLILPRCHSIVVFENALIEKSLYGRNRFICKVTADQIDHCCVNPLGEIVLKDTLGAKLLCIESGMTNRSRLEKWLADHHINTK